MNEANGDRTAPAVVAQGFSRVAALAVVAQGFSPAFGVALVIALIAVGHPTLPSAAGAPPTARATVLGLRRSIDSILAAPALDRTYWGILVRSLKSNETLFDRNAGKLMMPASNMKIVTLAAAANRLGWDFTYETQLIGYGGIEDGTLVGDLVVVGSGDPTIGREEIDTGIFDAWAEQLKAIGVYKIRGRIIGDDDAFDDETLGPGWAWDYLADGYATGVGALQFNENLVRLTVTAAAVVGNPPTIVVAPNDSGLEIVNHLTTVAADIPASVITRRVPGSARLELRGTVPLKGSALVRHVSVDNPTLFFVNHLRAVLVQHGLDAEGPAVDIDDAVGPPVRGNGTVFISYRSPPLSVIATRMMKFSQNLYAETLLKTIGGTLATPSTAGGRQVVRTTLQSWGVPPSGLVMIDGSGLSRYNLVTPETLVAILTHVDRDPRLRGPFEDTLPIWSQDGTLGTRSHNTRAANNTRAKTGSIANVRALSGYVNTADGEPLVFSILANNFETTPDVIDQATENIVVKLAEFRR